MLQLEALLKLTALDRLPRTGWLQAGLTAAESVAAHSHGTCLVVLALGPRVDPPLEVDRAVSLAALHDAPEALLSDLPRAATLLLGEEARGRAEEGAAEALLGPLSELALLRHREYREGRSREARFVRLCDRLHLGVRLLAYLRAGARGLDEFRRTLEELDCGEFPPCASLREELLGAIDEVPA